MRDDDSFRLLTPDDAVGLAAVLIVLLALGGALGHDEPVQKAPPRIACDVTVSQYGPGERWRTSPLPPSPACAGAVVSAPNHILTHPLPEAK